MRIPPASQEMFFAKCRARGGERAYGMSQTVTLTSLGGSFIGCRRDTRSARPQSPREGAPRKGAEPCRGEDRVRS